MTFKKPSESPCFYYHFVLFNVTNRYVDGYFFSFLPGFGTISCEAICCHKIFTVSETLSVVKLGIQNFVFFFSPFVFSLLCQRFFLSLPLFFLYLGKLSFEFWISLFFRIQVSIRIVYFFVFYRHYFFSILVNSHSNLGFVSFFE